MKTGWIDSGKYYLDTDGRMARGWKYIDGAWYRFAGSGEKQTGFVVSDNKNYYLGYDGRMITDWQEIDGIRYYFKPNGEMAVGWIWLDGVWFYFYGNGELATDAWIQGKYYVDRYGVYVE